MQRSEKKLSISDRAQGRRQRAGRSLPTAAPASRPISSSRIFEPFVTTKEHGLGLGLAICRKIARVHRGTLVAEDHDGDGATFRLVLPPARNADRKAA